MVLEEGKTPATDDSSRGQAVFGDLVGKDGKFHAVSPVSTLDQAEERANELRKKLKRRDVHPDILRFCKAELLTDNYFHAVLEATKSVASKIRGSRTGDADTQCEESALVC